MDNEQTEKTENNGEKKLIRETVFGGKLRGREALKRVLLVAGCAVVFGVIASLTFVLFKPLWENVSSDETTAEPITIYADESTEAPPAEAPSEEPRQVSDSTDVWGSILPSVHDTIGEELSQFASSDSINAARKATALTVNKSLVTVTATRQGTDWFESSVIDKMTSFGITVSQTTAEVIYLTPADAVPADGSIFVTLGDKQIRAAVKATDGIYGMAAIAIPASEIPDGTEITPISFGNSSVISQGSGLIIMGSPMEVAGSILYGMVSYTDMAYPETDASLRVFRTDAASMRGSRGFAVNVSGEMIGWLMPPDNSEKLSVIALSDIKTCIERLCNGSPMPMLGIKGQIVPPAQLSEGIPEGIYVNEVIKNSPAAEAGILTGDIITGADGESISNFAGLSKALSAKNPGDEITVTVSRSYRGTYSKVVLKATLSNR